MINILNGTVYLGKATPLPTASTSVAGIVQLATLQEASDGTNNTKAVTPAGLAEYWAQSVDLVQFVAQLPQTGESRYLYCVPLNEVDADNNPIVAMFVWNSTTSEWNAAGAFSTNIDPDTLLYKTDKNVANGVAGLNASAQLSSSVIPYATANDVGGIKQSFDATTGTWTVVTDNI